MASSFLVDHLTYCFCPDNYGLIWIGQEYIQTKLVVLQMKHMCTEKSKILRTSHRIWNSLHPLKPVWVNHRTRVEITEFTQIWSPLLLSSSQVSWPPVAEFPCSISLSTDNLWHVYHDKRSDCFSLATALYHLWTANDCLSESLCCYYYTCKR